MQNPNLPRRDQDVCAIVVAAGRGTRLGTDQNKLLVRLGGEPLLAHTARALVCGGHVGSLVLVTRPEEREALLSIVRTTVRRETLATHSATGDSSDFPIFHAVGGEERVDSIRRGVMAAPPSAKILLLHDGARPFLAESVIESVIAATRRYGACIPALSIVDTVKRVGNSRIRGTLDRAHLALAQTPQGFLAGPFREALQQLDGADAKDAAGSSSFEPTDDASLYEALGRQVHTVAGDPLNVKITRPGDVELAEAMLPVFLQREDARRAAASEEIDR